MVIGSWFVQVSRRGILSANNDVIDGDVDEFDKESDEAHKSESNQCSNSNLLKFYKQSISVQRIKWIQVRKYNKSKTRETNRDYLFYRVLCICEQVDSYLWQIEMRGQELRLRSPSIETHKNKKKEPKEQQRISCIFTNLPVNIDDPSQKFTWSCGNEWSYKREPWRCEEKEAIVRVGFAQLLFWMRCEARPALTNFQLELSIRFLLFVWFIFVVIERWARIPWRSGYYGVQLLSTYGLETHRVRLDASFIELNCWSSRAR